MAKYLLINKTTNIVENVVEVADDSWQPSDSFLAVPQDEVIGQVWGFDSDVNDFVVSDVLGSATIGNTYDGSKCITHETKPTPVEHTPTPSLTKEELMAQIQALMAKVESLS
jgi:hypothetical protein